LSIQGQAEARTVEAARVADAAFPLAHLVRVDRAVRLAEFGGQLVELDGEVVLRPSQAQARVPQLVIAILPGHRSPLPHRKSQFTAQVSAGRQVNGWQPI
jgi:hypothetical protein